MFKKKEKKIALKACTTGKIIPLVQVNDEVFSSGILGKGVGILSCENVVCAPVEGVITTVMEDSKHAVGITGNNGTEILLHIGIDTVKMNGEDFVLLVEENQRVESGQKLIEFDAELISQNGLVNTVLMLITNSDSYAKIVCHDSIECIKNETVVIEIG